MKRMFGSIFIIHLFSKQIQQISKCNKFMEMYFLICSTKYTVVSSDIEDIENVFGFADQNLNFLKKKRTTSRN